eukprot:CAMPEP_0181440176 /NCGR_PEP_ID=MMETSP1110-20121109/22832_1 /TAXON_ID=174948 /ORGANISM="Symbiodinium sp., Strain CCMP421" /LENGTH=83 /DNA_ID=CAMNT_0023563971 /DNA_START=324 /DNA_END=575 /DNA_ORIENTATION=+
MTPGSLVQENCLSQQRKWQVSKLRIMNPTFKCTAADDEPLVPPVHPGKATSQDDVPLSTGLQGPCSKTCVVASPVQSLVLYTL